MKQIHYDYKIIYFLHCNSVFAVDNMRHLMVWVWLAYVVCLAALAICLAGWGLWAFAVSLYNSSTRDVVLVMAHGASILILLRMVFTTNQRRPPATRSGYSSKRN